MIRKFNALLMVVLLALASMVWTTKARADSFLMNQDAVQMEVRPLCIGREETIRYARMLANYLKSHPESKIADAVVETRHLLVSHGGQSFRCYVYTSRPIYFRSPSDIIIFDRNFGFELPPQHGYLLAARADVIDYEGTLVTAEMAGGDIYVFPVRDDEIVRVPNNE